MTCGGLLATMIDTALDETLTSTSGLGVIQGLGRNELIRGQAGNDVVCGEIGNDRLFGGVGEDRLFGEADQDTLNGEVGFDRCDGGATTTDTAASCEQVSNVPQRRWRDVRAVLNAKNTHTSHSRNCRMKPQPSSVRMLPEQTVLSAWGEQLAQATPDLSQTLVNRQPELLPRFAACYTQLQRLPRQVRRRLQWQFRRMRTAYPASMPHRAQRRSVQSLAGLALLLALGQTPALAATIKVGGGCTLVDAITAANTNNAIGGCTAGSGADKIVLPANSTSVLTTVNNPTYAGNGLPVITSTITIVGNNSAIARSQVPGTPDFRLLFVDDTGKLSLQGLTLVNGSTRYGGGAVATRAGAVTLTNCTVTGNTAQTSGGGVRTFSGTLNITNSSISGNTAASRAGGVYSRGTVTLSNSTVSGNTARFDAGGLYNFDGTLTVTNSTIAGNSAPVNGGGIWNIGGRVTLTNSTISGNSVGNNGGGLSNISGIMTLINSTVSGNRAGRGGGVHSGGRYGNVRSDVVLFRSLISGNAAGKGAELYQVTGGVVSANHFNLFGHSGLTNAQALSGSLILSGASDITATADGSAPTALASILNPLLANNGGLTQTHALVLSSPAVDAASTGCPPPNTDQRGVPRAQDGNNDTVALCDIGAFELVRPGTVTCDGLPATKVGTPAAETINGTAGVDVIQGLGGNDLIKGLAGNDVLCGGAGNDQVLGGMGDDRLFGEADQDKLNGEVGFDRCDGGAATGDTAASCEQVSNVP